MGDDRGGVGEPGADPRPPVERVGDDRLRLRLGGAERRILGSVLAELRDALGDGAAAAPGGPLARLFPPAFPDDAEAEASYRELVGRDLLEGRRERLAVVEATLDAATLDVAQATAWLGVLNDLRLAIGTALGVEEDEGPALTEPDDPGAVQAAIFAWLGWLVAAFVEALEPSLPSVPDSA